jgi:hypothetical protein
VSRLREVLWEENAFLEEQELRINQAYARAEARILKLPRPLDQLAANEISREEMLKAAVHIFDETPLMKYLKGG